MSDDLPFQVFTRVAGTDLVTFVAVRDRQSLAAERYHCGSTARRAQVAAAWTAKSELWKGTTPNVEAVDGALEAAELRALAALDEQSDDDSQPATDADAATPQGKEKRESQSTILVRLALESGAELWHTADGDPFATIPVGGHRENWPARSKVFRRWLAKLFFDANGKTPGSQGVQDAVFTLEGKACFAGEEHPLHTRMAYHGGSIYLDLADADWRYIEISAAGWRVLAEAPVKFRRARGMSALSAPVAGGSLNELRTFINCGSDDQFILVLSWLVDCFAPGGPYAILAGC